ncbi:MAG: Rrf2 family transcriptional regulator [Planctomycetota bacterium]|nr:MAG: Rrf2 family transcriptional regulator [Planctomycetota bacterium]
MIYSATVEYAIRAMAHIATLEPGTRILARDLADATDVPRQFLGKILHRLARADLLDSAKGRGGGFRFARPAGEIEVVDVVAALDGLDTTNRCVLGLDECNDEQPCPLHDEWSDFRTRLMERVYSMSVAEMGKALAAKRSQAQQKPAASEGDDES